MTEIADRAFAGTRRPALAPPVRGRRRVVLSWFLLAGLLALAGPAAAAPVAVGLGFGADVPGVTAASELSIDRGDPLGFGLTVPVLVGRFRIEPQLVWTPLPEGRSYGVPYGRCPGLALCEVQPAEEDHRVALGLAVGPAWSLGDRGRLWAGPLAGLTFRWLEPGAVRRDWSLGASVGGEFFLDSRFSFGLDVRATYTSVDEGGTYTRVFQSAGTGSSLHHEFDRGWTAGVDGLAAFRVYLN